MDYVVILFLAWTLVAMAIGAFVATMFRGQSITNHIHMWPEPSQQGEDDPADAWKDGLDDS